MFKNNFALLIALLLAWLVVMPASATPPQPSGFYGTVTIDGSNAPDGTSITASINGTQYAQTTTFTYSGSSVYTLDVPGDDPDTPAVEGGVAGNTIVFRVNGQQAAQSTWAEGSNNALNLTATTPPATPTPQPTATATVPPTATAQPTITPSPTAPPAGSVNLVLEPSNVTTNVGESFEITIMAHAGSQQVDGVSAYINFDPTLMEVVSITEGDSFSLVVQNEFNNTTGKIDFAAGALSAPYPTGSFTVATITFNALTETDNSPLDFNTSLPRRSDVTFGSGLSVLGSTVGNSVTINNLSVILGAVSLEGRQDAPPPHERWSIPITVLLTIPGQSQPAYSFSTTTDQNGHFSVSDITPGSYNIGVKGSHTLRHTLTIDLAGGDNTIDFGLLREGDANNDNVVSILDFSILASTFAKCAGPGGFDGRADFDEDNCVTIRDFSLLATNFGQAGGAAPTTRAPETHAIDSEVALTLDAPSSAVAPGDSFNVTVRLEAGSQQIDGAQLALNFDAAYLEVESISAGETLPLELLNEIDNQRGSINFAAGILPEEGNSYPSGTIDLVQIQFKAKAESQEHGTALAFQAPSTNVTFGGSSILGTQSDTTITISNNPTAITTTSLTESRPSSAWLVGVLGLMLLAGGIIVRRKWDRARIGG